MGDFIGTTISGMTGRGSIRHNNRSFSAANVDRSRSGQNVTFCNEDLKKVYHELFDEALAAYNAKKKKTRDKIPDYYEHIRQSKQEKLFHEAIFQIGNLTDCGCGSPGGERAAAALKEFAESFQERNPHLRVFNMVLHMDEATPHLHVDFVPVATEQSRGLSTRVSMKQALKQQGFEGLGRKQTEWKAWMEREKEVLTEIAQAHEFEIISLGGGRPHMELPEYRAAAQRLEAIQEQVTAAEQEIAALEKEAGLVNSSVRLVLTRFGVVLSPDGGALPEMMRPARFGVTATAGNPDHLFSWVALEDLADALVFIMGRQDISGPVNVTAPERTTNREFYRAAAEHFHTRLSIRVPDAVLRLLMGEASQVITGGQCAVPETLMREGFTFQYPDIRTFFNKAFSVKS